MMKQNMVITIFFFTSKQKNICTGKIYLLIYSNCSWMVCWYDLCRNCCNDKTGEKDLNLERLAESSIALMIILAISGIVITIKLKFEGEKGRLVFAIIFLVNLCRVLFDWISC